MQIVTIQFGYQGGQNHERLLKVFKASVKYHMPNVEFIEILTPPPEKIKDRNYSLIYNDYKLKLWADYLDTASDNVIFSDCDMIALKSAEHAFNYNFDIAYTVTNRKIKPLNCGIIMARPTAAARAFMRQLYNVDHHMLNNRALHREWIGKYAGINQCAFGYMLNRVDHGAKLHVYKTIEWNAVDCDWKNINQNTVFVHCKSKLKRLLLRRVAPFAECKTAMELWYQMEREKV